MELILVRHAQPEWVEDGKSVLNPRLTELGRAQAQHLGEAARGWKKVSHLWVSPTRRTQETSAPLLELGVAPRTLPFLEEMRLPPAWDGASAETIGSALRTAKDRSLDEWHAGFVGGESFPEFEARITAGLAQALSELGVHAEDQAHPGRYRIDDPERRIVLVGHGGTNAVVVSHLLGLPHVPWAWERFVQGHAAVTRLKTTRLLGGHFFGLREHSDVSHLPDGLRTR